MHREADEFNCEIETEGDLDQAISEFNNGNAPPKQAKSAIPTVKLQRKRGRPPKNVFNTTTNPRAEVLNPEVLFDKFEELKPEVNSSSFVL